MRGPRTIVFVHGWSVRSTDTYGELPERLVRDAAARGWPVDVRHVWLSKYVSFADEVTVPDISQAFEAAVRSELGDAQAGGRRFACITHSTGGPVVRDWWRRNYLGRRGGPACPMSHLVMLAPANFGSALAQLGKGRLSRIKTWFQGVEPGTGVLDWLELGSPESWDLNTHWIGQSRAVIERTGVFPFVLTGVTIDRKLYDHVNSYTGEPGSDGVVRAAAANLNATFVRLVQAGPDEGGRLEVDRIRTAPDTAFGLVPGRSHSGSAMGILRSVRDDGEPHPTVDAVLRCLSVSSVEEYRALAKAFADEREAARTEAARHAMVVFRVQDSGGSTIGDFDLKLTAAPGDRPTARATPDLLPKGFFRDRQRNGRHRGTIAYYLNADAMLGASKLGFTIEPHVARGFVHFLTGALEASRDTLDAVIRPHQTTLVDVVMQRVVRDGLVRLDRLDRRSDSSFANQPAGEPLDRSSSRKPR